MRKRSSLEALIKAVHSPSRGKEADFASWAILKSTIGGDNPMTDSEFTQKLTKCGVSFKQKATPNRGDLKVGEYAHINKDECENPQNQEVCQELHNSVVLITKIVSSGVDCTISVKRVDIDGNPFGNELSFNGHNGGAPSGKKVGLYRQVFQKTIKETTDGKLFEIVYIKDKTSKPSPQYRIEQASQFVQQAVKDIDLVLTNSEKFLFNYYQGQIFSFTENKEGQNYCTISATNTRTFSEGIGNYVTINPSKGSLFYIGLVGHRPTGWLGELLVLIAKDNKPVSTEDEWDWEGSDVY